MMRLDRLIACASITTITACGPAPRPIIPVQIATATATNFVEPGPIKKPATSAAKSPPTLPSARAVFNSVQPRNIGPMMALVVSADGVLTAEAAAQAHRPVILMQAGIHAGEIEGKDAGFQFLLAMLRNELPNQALRAATWIFIPVLNPDGHERTST